MPARAMWDVYARTEPYFAVLTDSRYLRANLTPETEAEFFRTGEAYATHILGTVRQRFAPLFSPRAVLELGCGPGRVALALTKHTPRVVAVDSSPAMLELAQANAARFDETNIEFQTTEALLAGSQRFDLVNASLVFQHIPPGEGLLLLRRLLGHLEDLGVAVLTFPYRRDARPLADLTRAMRRRFPLVDATVRKRPFLYPYVYELGDVIGVLAEEECDDLYIRTEQQGEMDVATIYVRRIALSSRAKSSDPLPAHEVPAAGMGSLESARDDTRRGFIDVRELIANASMDELHRKAEEYFTALRDWEHHLAKPFAHPAETPPILINLAVLLQGLQLRPGLTVLEFGGGTGWLSRFLTQLGCRAILSDVSPSALEIARELYRRLPVIGERPAPAFLPFDGHRLDLPDESVDRIVTFDAFHHVINPDEVLAEFARVLRPGGIAAFAEPGPHHSKTAQSQFEMRTYGVVENDLDLRQLWSTASGLGFDDVRVAAYHVPPFHVSLDEYDNLLQGGHTFLRWANATREFMTNVRNFFLHKAGEEPVDSRRADALAAHITVSLAGPRVHASLVNAGRGTWLAASEGAGGVFLGCHLYDAHGTLLDLEYHRTPLPRPVASGETIELEFELPPLHPGTYELEFDLVAERVIWFAQGGSSPARVRVVR